MSLLTNSACIMVLVTYGTSTLAADLVGRVTKNGAPQSGARVSLESRTDKSGRYSAETDSAGNFRFTNLTLGTYVLKCNSAPKEVEVLPGVTRADCKD